MKRRHVLFGLGAAASGSAILGSGAFSVVEAHREVGIAVQGDADAFLELGKCLDDGDEPMPNAGFVRKKDGQMAIRIGEVDDEDTESPDIEGDGEGVNADALTTFDNVFRVCNQGTQEICVDFEADVKPIEADAPAYADSNAAKGDDSVEFYLGDETTERLPLDAASDEDDADEWEPAIHLEVGECACVGIQVRTFGIEPETQLFEDDRLTIIASAEAECDGFDDNPDDEDEEPAAETKAISWIAVRSDENDDPDNGLYPNDVDIEINERDDDNEPTKIEWEVKDGDAPTVEEAVVKAGINYFRYDVGGESSGTVSSEVDADEDAYEEVQGDGQQFTFADEEGPKYKRCPSSPFLGVGGVKIEFDGDEVDGQEHTETVCGGNSPPDNASGN